MRNNMAGDIIKYMPKVKGEITAGKGLAEFTRYRTGGSAEIFFSPADMSDLAQFLRRAPKDMNIYALGFGSNILIRDGGIGGIVIRLGSEHFSKTEVRPDTFEIKCGAFAPSAAIAKAACDAGIAGMEFLSGIPGSIGGAVLMNAGCFGGEVKSILVEIEAVDKRTGEIKILQADECSLAYRNSEVPESLVITSALLRGRAGKREKIIEKMEKIKQKKDATQPTYAKTAGSVFKNPEGQSAWKLIKDTGCQGLKLGGAAVSPLHANFIINENDATSADIEDLAEKIRFAVYEKFGIMLEYEIKILGARAAG